jgi:hypothetical protein
MMPTIDGPLTGCAKDVPGTTTPFWFGLRTINAVLMNVNK